MPDDGESYYWDEDTTTTLRADQQPCQKEPAGFPRVFPSRRKVSAGAEPWTQTGTRFSLLFQRKQGSAGIADTSRINAGRSLSIYALNSVGSSEERVTSPEGFYTSRFFSGTYSCTSD